MIKHYMKEAYDNFDPASKLYVDEEEIDSCKNRNALLNILVDKNQFMKGVLCECDDNMMIQTKNLVKMIVLRLNVIDGVRV